MGATYLGVVVKGSVGHEDLLYLKGSSSRIQTVTTDCYGAIMNVIRRTVGPTWTKSGRAESSSEICEYNNFHRLRHLTKRGYRNYL